MIPARDEETVSIWYGFLDGPTPVTTGVCEKNDHRYIRPYRAIAILGRTIRVGMHFRL